VCSFSWKPNRKRPLTKRSRKEENNIKTNLREVGAITVAAQYKARTVVEV